MKVVAHNGAHIFGGAEIAVCRLLSGLAGRGHDVVLYCNGSMVEAGAHRHGIRTGRCHLGGDAALHHAVRWAAALRRERPDAVLLTTFRKFWLGGLGARLARAPSVVARIGLESDVPRSTKYRLVFRHLVDTIVVNADDLRRRYLELLPELSPCEVVRIYKGFTPLSRTRGRVEVRRDLGIPADAPLVGAIGRLVPQKRFDRVLRAVALLSPDVRLVVAGDGDLREPLERQCRQMGLQERVRFTGHLEEVGDLLGAIDVLALTSERESLANVMLEALAGGVPVVSTPVSGAREALQSTEGPPAGVPHRRGDGDAAPGRVVAPEPEAIARALEEILRDGSLRAAMSRSAKRRAATCFSRSTMLDGWEAALAGTGCTPHTGLASSARGPREDERPWKTTDTSSA